MSLRPGRFVIYATFVPRINVHLFSKIAFFVLNYQKNTVTPNSWNEYSIQSEYIIDQPSPIKRDSRFRGNDNKITISNQ